MEEEESPVVREIPVFLSQSLANNLVLYQYPLERTILDPDKSDILQCKIKPSPHEVQLDLALNTDSSNYCSSRGEQIALNVDGKGSVIKNPEDVVFPRQLMDKQTLYSRAVADQNCAVGLFHENELHMTPVDSIALLRPGFKYLDKSDKRIKTEAGDVDMSGDEEEEMKQVTVKFARQESERNKKARERSFGYVSKMSAKESWFRANYYKQKTDKSELEFNKLYCRKVHDKIGGLKQDLGMLLIDLTKDEEDCSVSLSHGESLSKIKNLPLLDKIKKLLLEAKLLQFTHLRNLLELPPSEINDCLRVIQQVGVLVQGCWVVQSDVLYCKEFAHGGVPAAYLKSCRDYILFLFNKNRTVTRKKIMNMVKLPPDVVKQILEDFAELKPNKEWEFFLPTDLEFSTSYPEIYERQQKKWELKHDKLLILFKSTETNSASSPTRQRRKSLRESSISSDNESGTDNKKALLHLNNKLRRTKKHSVSFSDTISYSDGGTAASEPS